VWLRHLRLKNLPLTLLQAVDQAPHFPVEILSHPAHSSHIRL
jgi:hypothetical protein